MAGKYQKLRGKIAKYTENSTYQEKVEAWKQGFLKKLEETKIEPDIKNILNNMCLWKVQKKRVEKDLYEVNLAIIALNQMATESMEAAGLQKVELTEGGLGYLGDGVYPSVKDKEKFMAWVKKKKLTSMLTFPWQSLKGLVGERLINNEAPPDGVEVFLKTEVKFRGIPNLEGEDE